MEIGTGKKKMGLSTQIFIALLAGAICGVCVHYFLKEGYFRDTILVGGVFYVLGQGFIRLMQMLVVPLVLKPKQGKKVPSDLDDFDLEDEEEYLTEDEEMEEKNE